MSDRDLAVKKVTVMLAMEHNKPTHENASGKAETKYHKLLNA
jgi:hypothetical protein